MWIHRDTVTDSSVLGQIQGLQPGRNWIFSKGNRGALRWLAAEIGEEPQDERENDPNREAGDDGEVEGGVFAAVDDVAGEAAEAEGETCAEVEQGADDDDYGAEDQQEAAEVAERVHERSLGGEIQEVKEVKEVEESGRAVLRGGTLHSVCNCWDRKADSQEWLSHSGLAVALARSVRGRRRSRRSRRRRCRGRRSRGCSCCRCWCRGRGGWCRERLSWDRWRPWYRAIWRWRFRLRGQGRRFCRRT